MSTIEVTNNFYIPNVKNNQLITIITEFDGIPAPSTTLSHCRMPHNKNVGFLPYKDDAGLADYTGLFKYLQGVQTDDGLTYDLWTFNDGCGNQLPAKFTIALNANPIHNEDSGANEVAKWSNLIEMFAIQTGSTIGCEAIIGWRLCYPGNHGLNHGGTNMYNEIKNNSKVFWDKFKLFASGGIVPQADAGYAASGPILQVPIWMSEWGVEGMNDGYSVMTKMFPTLINLYRQLCTRYYCGTDTTDTDVNNFEFYVNQHYDDCTGEGDEVGYMPYFYHGNKGPDGKYTNFTRMIDKIRLHDRYDEAGIYTIQEALDYEIVRRGVFKKEKIIGNKLYTYLSYSGIDRHFVYYNASFIVENAGKNIINVSVSTDIKNVFTSYNPSTNLINMYAENPFIINSYQDTTPPLITSLIATDDEIVITYDKSVIQSNSAGYSVIDIVDPDNPVENNVISITGSGTTWTLLCTDSVTNTSKFYYKVQDGNAIGTNGIIATGYYGSTITVN